MCIHFSNRPVKRSLCCRLVSSPRWPSWRLHRWRSEVIFPKKFTNHSCSKCWKCVAYMVKYCLDLLKMDQASHTVVTACTFIYARVFYPLFRFFFLQNGAPTKVINRQIYVFLWQMLLWVHVCVILGGFFLDNTACWQALIENTASSVSPEYLMRPLLSIINPICFWLWRSS